MTTSLHQSFIDKFAEAGYRTSGFKEFCRLVYYVQDELGFKEIDALSDYFASGKAINQENSSRIAKKFSARYGDEVDSYDDVRLEVPAPRRIPDAWRFREDPNLHGRGIFEIIEVLDTSRTGIAKLGEYAASLDHFSFTNFVVYEVSAKDGAVVTHDAEHAWALMLYQQINEPAVSKTSKDTERLYSEHLLSRIVLP